MAGALRQYAALEQGTSLDRMVFRWQRLRVPDRPETTNIKWSDIRGGLPVCSNGPTTFA
ncbi:hypothetical protein CERZMDRAFT_90782 [Cercospora zeae-maydis SCOH1-5]|uniref:Uncharacterized protein n=1 Tax=Cercospora zeae-maydis SCOH1-5 TaxID=717836 RepID=A0A6A6FET3_9PEZI|nr:hypothetical protein CERZMDRAFT_90782 [Cercospora zeae-maydis SCOH1-5]